MNPSEDNSLANTPSWKELHVGPGRDGGWLQLERTTKEALGLRNIEVVWHDITTGGTPRS